MTDEQQNSVTPEYIESTFRTEAHVEWRTELAFETLHKAAEALREARESVRMAKQNSIRRHNELKEVEAERDRLAEENRRLRERTAKAEQVMRGRARANTQRSDHASRAEVYTECADLLAGAPVWYSE